MIFVASPHPAHSTEPIKHKQIKKILSTPQSTYETKVGLVDHSTYVASAVNTVSRAWARNDFIIIVNPFFLPSFNEFDRLLEA